MKHVLWVLVFGLLAAGCGAEASDSDSAPAKQGPSASPGTQPEPEASPQSDSPPSDPGSSGDSATGDVAVVDGELGATETNVAAAPCMTDADCPEGVRCAIFGDAGLGFCDVQDTLAP
jgi:hypothetical protein